MPTSRKLAIIGDLVASRELPNREHTQNQLKKTFRRFKHKKASTSPWTITLGDEFQAVYTDANGLCENLIQILLAAWPARIRFSAGIASLDTQINSSQALGMDGPAFHIARDGIDRLKKSGSYFTTHSDLFDIETKAVDNLGALLFRILYQARNSNRAAVLLKLMQNMNGKKIAKELNMSESAVSQHIETAGLHELSDTVQTIEELIQLKLTAK
jgi:hypothetical protein